MNALNTTGSPTGRASGGSISLLSQSSFYSRGGATGSNYAANLVLGNNLSSAPPSGSIMLPSTATSGFASEAYKSRAAMESASGGLKTQAISSPLDTATSIGKTTSAVASAGAMATGFTPIALAMQVSQAIGEGIQASLNTSAQNTIGRDYQSNLQSWSIGGNKAAESTNVMQQQQLASANSGAAFGSIFGPVGALVGWWAGMQSSSAPSAYNAYQVGSFGGGVSASDSGVAPSVNSDAITGNSTMENNL